MNDNENKLFGKKINFKRSLNFENLFERIQENLPLMICTCIFSFILMALVALAVFFVSAEGAEKVLVPNVTGKKLEDGLIEMQAKELYPKITLRFSESAGDEGTILEQSPEAGAIVKGYSRVSLVISKGAVIDEVGNYIDTNIDELKMKLQTLFAGSVTPLITIGDITYKPDVKAAGTILEQDPPEGTYISNPVKLNLVVSRGPAYENTRPPLLIGKNINDVIQTIARSKIIFDFKAHTAKENEVPGTVVAQDEITSEFVPNYSHMSFEIALPAVSTDGLVYGIFEKQLEEMPWAVQMRLDALSANGEQYTIVNFTHTGGLLTIPYAVPSNTTLILYIAEKENSKLTVH